MIPTEKAVPFINNTIIHSPIYYTYLNTAFIYLHQISLDLSEQLNFSSNVYMTFINDTKNYGIYTNYVN